MVVGGFRTVSDPTFSSASGKELAFRNESPARRFHFPLHNILVRAASSCGRNYRASNAAFAPLASDGNSRSIASRMAFSPVSAKVASPYFNTGVRT